MKKKYAYLLLLTFSLLLMDSRFAQSQADHGQTFTGEIMDTLCTEHKGHQYMMQQMKSMGTDKVTCTQKCIQLGAKLALFNAGTGTTYVIANPEKAESFDGRQVQVSGTLNKKRITISEIKAAE